MTRTVSRALLALPVAAALLLSACGGGDGGSDSARPTADEIAELLGSEDTSGLLSDTVLDCMAKAYVDSDLSDETLRAMVEKDAGYTPSEEDATLLAEVTMSAATECATA